MDLQNKANFKQVGYVVQVSTGTGKGQSKQSPRQWMTIDKTNCPNKLKAKREYCSDMKMWREQERAGTWRVVPFMTAAFDPSEE